MDPGAGGRGSEQEQAQPGGHSGRGQPIAPLQTLRVQDGHVPEDEQQLQGKDGLDEREGAEMQGRELEAEPQDHAPDACQPDGAPCEPEGQTRVETGHLAVPCAQALTHRGGRRAEAGRDGQQDRLVHLPQVRVARCSRYRCGLPSASAYPCGYPGVNSTGRATCIPCDQAAEFPAGEVCKGAVPVEAGSAEGFTKVLPPGPACTASCSALP